MAAAYAALVSVLNDLEDIQNHPIHSFSFDDNQIQSLSESVAFLIDFMESYDNCYGPSKEAAQLLERRITCAAQAAEEVIESHVVNQINGGSTLGGKKKRSPRFLLDLQKVNQDMDYMRRKAIKVQEARSGLDLKQPTCSAAAASSSSSSSSTQPDLTSEKTTMVGFDELLLQLLDLLTGYHSSRQVIPIVGAGGIGKTTLARNVFDHKLIVQHFDVCLWATISQQYVVQDILSTLLSRQPKSDNENVGELGDQLHKRLFGRRYLIVLDHMWSVVAWDKVKSFFPDTNNGSRIVVTTRLSDLANQIGSVSPLAVSLLDDDQSWDLFCQKAFAAGEGCPPELEDVGKSIVRKCKGLPLAIIVVAGHLGRQEYWVNVANDMKSVLNSEENKQLFNILSFSYTHLPVHLKPCFVYMGTFPEDREISVPDLIRRWIADGFMRSCRGDNLEEIAKAYLKDLIDRNLILDIPSESPFKEDRCKIHDVLRELCLKVAEKEMFFYMDYTHSRRAMCRERRVGIREKVGEENHHPEIFEAARVAPPQLVRSLEVDQWETHSFDLRLCRVMRKDFFRVVNAPFQEEADFQEADFQHANLRYLNRSLYGRRDVSHYLSSSISRCWNLQTLIIRSILNVRAPNEIWEMIQLRHLEVSSILGCGIYLPDPLPSDKLEQENELVLRNLHTLMGVENLKLSEEFCRRVPNIKELRVMYSESDKVRWSDYCPHNLDCFRKLKTLILHISRAGNEPSRVEYHRARVRLV